MPFFHATPSTQRATSESDQYDAQLDSAQHMPGDEGLLLNNSVDNDDWRKFILNPIELNNRLAPPALGVMHGAIPLTSPFEFGFEPLLDFSNGAFADVPVQEATLVGEPLLGPIDWSATSTGLLQVPTFALDPPTSMTSVGHDESTLPWWMQIPPSLPLPMPPTPSSTRLGKRKRVDRVSEIEEGNVAGPSRLAAAAAPNNLGPAAQVLNKSIQSASSATTNDGDDTDAEGELDVPDWVAKIDAIAVAPWSKTLFINRQRDRFGKWKVDCLLCARPIGATERRTAKRSSLQRADIGHEHRVRLAGDTYRRTPCEGMHAVGASYDKDNRMRTPYSHDRLERLALALVRRYPNLLDSQFRHDQIAPKTVLYRDLTAWLAEEDGQRLLAMRMHHPSVDLKSTIDEMAVALEVKNSIAPIAV